MRLNSEAWRDHVAKQRSSGVSVAEYCRRAGLPLSTFRLKASGQSAQSGKFVPVETGDRARELEVIVGRAVIRVPPGSDMEAVKRLVEALS